jgi:AbrB family looped-hinge helix DNA binding protein
MMLSRIEMSSSTPSRSVPLVISPRGQITLPKGVRTRLRLAPGSVVLLREEDGRLVLDPAAVTPVEHYSDEQIERLLVEDQVTPADRAAIRHRWRIRARRRRG